MPSQPGPSDSHADAPKARKPKSVGASGGPKPVAPKAVTPKAVAPKPVTPKAVTPKAVTPKAVTPKPVTPKPVTPKAVTPKPVTPKPVTPKAVTPKPVTPKAVTPKPVTPKAVTPKAVTPKPVTPKAVTPKAVTPKPVAPKKAAPKAAPSSEAPNGGAGPDRPLASKPKGERPDVLLGKRLGRCVIEALVGVGRTARVYRAHYEALDDTVAIKVLRREIAQNPLLVERFDSEARAIAKVDNENVLKIYDVGMEDGLYYMVVELLEGEEILDLIAREQSVDVTDALRITRQAANGLQAAHGHGLVHRDIKPQNLFLLEDGTVKVVDFGLATAFDDSSERVGTPHYMAPETCESGTSEFASDIYALGIVLYHMLVGHPPHAGQDIRSILRAHMKGKPLRPEHEGKGIPREVADLVRLLTKRDPLLRPSAEQVIEELDRIGGKELRQKGSLRRRRGRARSAVARRARKGKGKGTPAVGAILGALAVVGIIAFALSGDDEAPRRDTEAETERTALADPNHGLETVDPVETDAERKAKAERAWLAERLEKSKTALERAEVYARKTWRTPEDTSAVLAKYVSVISRYRDTPGAKEAKRRIDAIKRKEMHPHPDRKLTTRDRLEAVRKAWAEDLPTIEGLIADFDYAAARALVPEPVSDESGRLARELNFWREHGTLLVDFQKALITEVARLPGDEREIDTPEGEGQVRRITPKEFEVRVGTSTHRFSWEQIGAEPIGELALATFSGKGARLIVLGLAFSYAHRLEDLFWNAKLELGATPGSGVWSRQEKEYGRRFSAWMKSR